MVGSECTGATQSAGDTFVSEANPGCKSTDANEDEIDAGTVTLDNVSWFHGRLSKQKACELLQDNGEFLVRLARSKADSALKAVLSAKWQGRHYNFEIRERHGHFFIEELRFDSIVMLIQHYLNSQCAVTRRSGVLLQEPVARPLNEPFILRGAINIMVACLIVIFLYLCSII